MVVVSLTDKVMSKGTESDIALAALIRDLLGMKPPSELFLVRDQDMHEIIELQVLLIVRFN